jgi:valyl-tRNA synthetase
VHDVPFSARSGQRIEPLISLQWFCDMKGLAEPAIAAARDGSLRFHPEKPWTDIYLTWLENIRPWCISRQLWWGHQIPVWYCEECDETIVATEPPDRCGACGGAKLRRDPDVLDTWFSSALWPFATLGWPNDTPELRAFYPTDVNSTARDIIFLWVARMVMMGVEFTGKLPFHDVNIHSLIMAPDGRRMSKSLGTGIDPIQAIDSHGADATRFGLLAMSSSQNVRYSEEKIQQGQELANKLWNASRLILLGAGDAADAAAARPQTVEDRWILSRLERLTERITALLDGFEFSRAALELYAGFWGEVCDWYLEFVKPRLRAEEPDADTAATVLHVLERCLRLLHPIMPFVTEEIWSHLPGERGLLAADEWPAVDASLIDDEAEAEVARTIEAVTALRRYRQDVGAPAAAWIPARLAADGYDATAEQVARLARFSLLSSNGGDPVATIAVPGGSVQVFETEDIDSGEAERRRQVEREKLQKEIARLEGKLGNEKFVERAPAAVVEGERSKLEAYRRELEELGA